MGRNICDVKKTAKTRMPTCGLNEHLLVLQGVPNKDIKMAALSLTEEMFSIIQGYSYVESMKYISPGSGLPEGMF